MTEQSLNLQPLSAAGQYLQQYRPSLVAMTADASHGPNSNDINNNNNNKGVDAER